MKIFPSPKICKKNLFAPNFFSSLLQIIWNIEKIDFRGGGSKIEEGGGACMALRSFDPTNFLPLPVQFNSMKIRLTKILTETYSFRGIMVLKLFHFRT